MVPENQVASEVEADEILQDDVVPSESSPPDVQEGLDFNWYEKFQVSTQMNIPLYVIQYGKLKKVCQPRFGNFLGVVVDSDAGKGQRSLL